MTAIVSSFRTSAMNKVDVAYRCQCKQDCHFWNCEINSYSWVDVNH